MYALGANMSRHILILLGGLLALGLGLEARADSIRKRGSETPQPFMRTYGETPPPFGFVQFCYSFPAQCRMGSLEGERFPANAETLNDLDRVNREVNRLIQPATDQELYGINELWTLPRDKGDCEDYALLKRHILIARGWPVSALLMTVVRDEKGEGHAVLTARTSLGDYILDNKASDVRLWYLTPYSFVMRQSYLNPKIWMSLETRDSGTPAQLAGVRSAR
jgi:predicted transglutaminase-like cysteine proteinase